MTEKGYEFLKQTSAKYKSLYNLVVVGNDPSLQKDYAQEIIEFCDRNNINYVRKSHFTRVETEYAMAISWRWLIKHPPEKLIVFHDSPLPKYRGFAPLVNALINGENEIGVSAIFGANEFDTGDIIAQYVSAVSYPIKINDAIKLNNNNYTSCAEIVLNKLLNNLPLNATKQDESKASYSVWRDEQDYKIDWNMSDVEICRLIDAVGFPYKGASTILDGKVVRILQAEATSDVDIVNRTPGKVLFIKEGKPVVICGKGMLVIIEAYIEEHGLRTNLFPIPKFRIRFTN